MKEVDDPKVIISTTKKDSQIKISIADVGKGIKEEHKSRIFEPFFTTKDVGSGTGLGLSVSHGIINKMNGSIHVESTFGKGTTFIIQLPITKQ
jgi:signal transduction histidine kinase